MDFLKRSEFSTVEAFKQRLEHFKWGFPPKEVLPLLKARLGDFLVSFVLFLRIGYSGTWF